MIAREHRAILAATGGRSLRVARTGALRLVVAAVGRQRRRVACISFPAPPRGQQSLF